MSPLEDFLGPICSHLGATFWCFAAITGPSAVVTNDCLWIVGPLVALVTIPNNHQSAISLFLWAVWLGTLGLVNSFIKSHRVFGNMLIYFLGLAFVWMIVYLHEKNLRVKFVDKIVARHFAKQQAIGAQAQSALLASMLPDFVIAPLTAWLASNFDPAKTVLSHYDKTCVAFIRMSPDATLNSQQAAVCEMSVMREHEDDDGSTDWLFNGHNAVDRVLLAGSKAVDKVKTVGDLIIIAGSFRGHSSEQAAGAMLSLVTQIHSTFVSEESMEHCVTIGVHAGPVIAVVLGYSRLSFDIFGDTVNTTSRIMTNPNSKNKIAASTEFISLLPQAPFHLKHPTGRGRRKSDVLSPLVKESAWTNGETVEFGPVTEIKAKGKGMLQVREIQHSS